MKRKAAKRSVVQVSWQGRLKGTIKCAASWLSQYRLSWESWQCISFLALLAAKIEGLVNFYLSAFCTQLGPLNGEPSALQMFLASCFCALVRDDGRPGPTVSGQHRFPIPALNINSRAVRWTHGQECNMSRTPVELMTSWKSSHCQVWQYSKGASDGLDFIYRQLPICAGVAFWVIARWCEIAS